MREKESRKMEFKTCLGKSGNIERSCFFPLWILLEILLVLYSVFPLCVLFCPWCTSCPPVNLCLSLFSCLHDSRSVLHDEKKNLVKISSSGGLSLNLAALYTVEADLN